MGVLLEVLSCSGISGALEVHFLYWGCASCPVSPRWEREIFRKVNSALSRIPLHVLVCVCQPWAGRTDRSWLRTTGNAHGPNTPWF